MNNEEKATEISKQYFGEPNQVIAWQASMKMAVWKDEQLGWHDANKEQPPMDEEVIVLTNILNGKELSTPRMICFGHIDYDGWNIPGVAYWMYFKEPK